MNAALLWLSILGGLYSTYQWPQIMLVLLGVWVILRALQLLRSPLHKIPGPPCYDPRGMIFQIIKEGPYQPQLRWAKEFGTFICYRRFPLTYMVSHRLHAYSMRGSFTSLT
jgi:hypothetical protein